MVGALAGLDAAELEDPRAGGGGGSGPGWRGGRWGRRCRWWWTAAGRCSSTGWRRTCGCRRWAAGSGRWRASGASTRAGAVAAALGALGRGRDRGREAAAPVGRFAVRGGVAVGMGVPFGQMEAAALAGLAAAVGDGELRPAAGRGLIVVGAEGVGAAAEGLGFVVDPRRSAAGDRGLLRGAGLRCRRGWRRGSWRRSWRGRPELLRRGAAASLGVRQAVRAAGGGLRVAGGGGGRERDGGGGDGGAEAGLRALPPGPGSGRPAHPPARGPAAALVAGGGGS